MKIDTNIMKECLSVLMVGGKERADVFQQVRTWAVRNEARMWTALELDPKNAASIEPERKRWDALIEIFDSIAQENQVEQMQN